MKYIVGNNILG